MSVLKQLFTFKKGGVHPNDQKSLTEGLAIEPMPLPKEVAVMLGQHIGAPCTAQVKKGDTVTQGQCIGIVEKGLGTNVHSPCDGKVKVVGNAGHPLKIMAPAIVIEPAVQETVKADDKTEIPSEAKEQAEAKEQSKAKEQAENKVQVFSQRHEWASLEADELLNLVKDAGIVGAGGAGFPAHVKLKPPADVKITELVINGAECEPYLTADHRMMLECADGILEGIQIAMKILGVSKCLIGIENNKMDAIEAMGKASEGKAGISVCTLKTKYPQGGERQLVYALTGRRIASGALPSSVGVVVQNISTAYAIYEAVVLRKPMYERVMTISGRGIKRQANLRVAVGTRISDIVAYLGGTTDDLEKVILGGPMMGFATSDLSTPVTKTTSGILFLTKDETDLRAGGPCVRCGWCLDACPMGLEPKEIALYVEAGKGKETAQFGVKDCFECGSCAFVCPAKRPLVQLIRLAKKSLPK